jgi:hypothetical protein
VAERIDEGNGIVQWGQRWFWEQGVPELKSLKRERILLNSMFIHKNLNPLLSGLKRNSRNADKSLRTT